MSEIASPEIEFLASLLRFGLFGGAVPSPMPLTESQWQSLFDLSRRQAVTALTYDAVLKLPPDLRPPRRVLFHFATVAETVERDNRRREAALCHFAALCRRQLQLAVTVVKGSSLSALYPEPLHRECGDNDLYSGSDTQRIGAMLETMGIDVDRKDPRHITFLYEHTTFEAHNYLLYHNDDPQWHSVQAVQQEYKEGTSPSPSEAYFTLPPAESAFFLAKHCEHHSVFFHAPVRLRTLLDWAMLLSGGAFDYAAFCRLKQGTDVDVFADLLTHYCNTLFGLELPCDSERLENKRLRDDDFYNIYMCCPQRHPSALVRVARRSGKYLRFSRQYRAIYGQSMFRRFYLKNLGVAVRQHL